MNITAKYDIISTISDKGADFTEDKTKVGVISIIIEDYDKTDELNEILHQYSQYIIGRMGLPYRPKNINIISVAVDAPQDIISALSGKIGNLKGISAKSVSTNI